MATILDDIVVLVNDDIANIFKSKSIKTKPKTFTGTKEYYYNNLNFGFEEQQKVRELTDEEREKLAQKIGKLDSMETEFTDEKIVGKAKLEGNKPIKIKPNMYENLTNNYMYYQLQQLTQGQVEEVSPEEVVEPVQDEEISKMVQTVREETQPVIESKSIEQIQNEEVNKLMKLIRVKDLVENSKSLVQIQDEEIQKLLEKEKPLRDEIQVVPERPEKYQEIIDNEFANQEVTMISSEEVEKAVNPDIADIEAPTKVSKYSQKEINMDKQNVIKMIENSISEALKRIKKDEGKDIDQIFTEIYNQNKEEVSEKFDQIEEETGKSVEDIFTEIYLKNRRSIDDIFTELYGNNNSVVEPDNKSIEDYFAEIYTKTGKNVEEIFADIYDKEDRETEEVFNDLYKDNQDSESIEDIFQEIYNKQIQKTSEIFEDFEESTGNSIDEIFANIYDATGKNVDQIFSETYGTEEGKSDKSIEDYFTEIRIAQGKTADEVIEDIYQDNKESIEEIFNKIYRPAKIIDRVVNEDRKVIKVDFQPIRDKITFEDIFTKAEPKNNLNDIHFDYSRTTQVEQENAVEESTDNKSELSEILRIVREKQNEKSELAREIQLAAQTKSEAEQQRLKASLELEEREHQRREAEIRVTKYLRQLEIENEADMNKIENIQKNSEDLYKQTEDLIQEAEKQKDAIDEMYEAIGQVSLRSAA